MVETLIREVAAKFGISSGTAQTMMSALMSLISSSPSGLTGFLDKFRTAGMGDLVSSWLGSVDPAPITGLQVERALGHETVEGLAKKAGAPMSIASSALGFVLPKLIGLLTPGGSIPTTLPAWATSFLGAPARPAMAAPVEPERKGNRWLVPLLASLGLLALLAYFLGGNKPETWDYAAYMRTANERAMAALRGLQPGVSASSVVSALNLQVVNFATGSADIPEDAKPLLNLAAGAIKMAPEESVIQIGGHTDNTGDAASNEALSQRRAEAVKAYLVSQGVSPGALDTRGYGPTKPVASNETEEGRFRNRRIEYALAR